MPGQKVESVLEGEVAAGENASPAVRYVRRVENPGWHRRQRWQTRTRAAARLRDRLARQGEDALGKVAQELLENPIVTGAIARAFDARERAVRAQETAMSALNLPSAADLERLTRRLRSVSQRLEGIEDGVDRLDRRLEEVGRVAAPPGDRLAALEAQLGKLAAEVAQLVGALGAAPVPVPREQERLEVDEPPRSRAGARPRKRGGRSRA